MKLSANILLFTTGLIPTNLFRKKVDFSKTYIIIPNHSSYLDAVNIYTAMPKIFKSLGKKELENVPVYGTIFKTVCISIDRSSLKARALSFRKMKAELERGISILIFPEGTFPDEPRNDLLPFLDGCFSLAIMQQVELLPVLFQDSSNRIHPSNILKISIGKNRSIFLPPISTNQLQKDDIEKLKLFTQNYMQSCKDFLAGNEPSQLWNYAMEYQKNHSIL
ncbi:MAG TPA: lysophospholipid acyltransferase family protein [Chitinophagaceae bacterium]|nr:lysophospholipid acyltransferase family protein [Chitinophagaceae bacterium]